MSWAAAVGVQVASVLAEAHRLSAVHREIEPGNLFLTPGGVVKVLGFGAAVLAGADPPERTVAGHTAGTSRYLAPEQALPSAVEVGPPADLYALGCVLHELLTGAPPFTAGDPRQILQDHLHGEPPPARRVRPEVPEPVERLVLALLAKDPEARPHTDDIYETLLPYTRAGGSVAGHRELDPTRPFTRPMAPVPRRRRPAPPQPALSQEEADATAERAAELVDEKLYVQAADVLERAIGRAGADPEMEYDLRLRLAYVLLATGSYRRALAHFEVVEVRNTDCYGPADHTVLDCRYHAATCRAALGGNTAALRAFHSFLREWTQAAGPTDERALDVRRRIGLLQASAGRHSEARATLSGLLADATRVKGGDSELARHVAALLDRLDRYRT